MPSSEPIDSPASSDGIPARLFDFQVNGFGGVDFQRDDLTAAQLRHSVDTLRGHGVTGIFATLITDEIDRLCRRLEAFERFCAADAAVRAMIAGYHVEGPWLNPERGYCGAHPPGPMHAPNVAEFERLQAAAGGRVKLITLAPEWAGSAEVIAHATAKNVHISLGHTNAGDAEIDEAIRAGARFCTHLGNGCPAMLPRHDNIVQRLLARDELTACFIPDGVHLPDFTLRNFVRAKPAGRVLFTTDAMAGAGAAPGRYTLGELEVLIGDDRIARHPENNTFAGSTLTPDDGVRRIAQSLQLPFGEAVRLWSDAPRAAFGLSSIRAT
jgi:N-acetylglucosamine-6-phosphate deacetylase